MAINFPDPSQQTTYVADSGVTYEFIDGVWKATTFAGLGDVRYVNSTGDDMSGNLTIATDKISLNTDGSASFAGTVDANALTVDGAAVDTSAEVDAKVATKTTEAYVNQQIAAIPPTDLSAYDTSAEVTAKVAALETSLTDGAPGALDTLNELAASLGDDSNFAGTVTNSLAGKADLSGATFTGDVTASAFIGDGSQLTGVGSETIISSTPPTPADYEVGTMWWNSDSTDTSLYILYQDPTGPNSDAGGKYWIEAAPAPDSIGFDGTHTGDSTFTGNMNVTGTVDAGLVNVDRVNVVNTTETGSDVVHTINTGSSLITTQRSKADGSLQIGSIDGNSDTANIELNADGSAAFAGDITVENTPSPTIRIIGTGQGTALFGQGWDRAPGGNKGAVIAADNGPIVFRRGVAYNGDPGNTAVGTTAMFIHQDTGNVYIGGDIDTDVTNRNIELKSDGSATFNGEISSGTSSASLFTRNYSGGSPNIVGAFRAQHEGSDKAVIFTDGSASFAGDVVRGTYAANSNYCALRDGQLEIGRNTNDGNLTLIKGTRYNGATTYDTFNFKADGSANFAGGVGADYFFAGRNTTDANLLSAAFGYTNTTTTLVKGTGIFLGTSLGNANGAVPDGTNLRLLTDGSASFAGDLSVTSASTDYKIRATNTAAGGGGLYINNTSSNNNNILIRADAGLAANQVLTIYASGSATFAGNITAGNVSDIKFKENIEAAPAQLADIEAFELKTFDWKDEAPLSDELKAQRKLGLIAQEVEAICPEMVYEVADQDDDSYKAINHDVLIMKLLGAVKELAAEVAALKAS